MSSSTSAEAVPKDILSRQLPSIPPSAKASSDATDSSDVYSTDGTEVTTDVDDTEPDSENKYPSMAILIPTAFLTMVAVAGVAGAQMAREVEMAAATTVDPTVEAMAQTQNTESQIG